ncbi:MAG TPA: hypothetical protein VFS67_33350 [Polyangiaceae bacterium]|nr:hypothetical protein [Polyangiaceae bacterium]
MLVGGSRIEQPAYAQTEPTVATGCSGQLSASGSGDGAAGAFDRFQCTLERRDYAGALGILDAVCTERDAGCAFNRALVYHAWLEQPGEREREHCQLARRNYLVFLDLEPYSEQRAAAARALQELEQFCPRAPAALVEPAQLPPEGMPALRAAAPPRVLTSPESSAPGPAGVERTGLRATAGRILLGVGSAAAAAAAISWLRMARADADLVAQRQPGGGISRTPENESLDQTRHVYQRWAWGLGISASALLGTGALLLLFDEPAAPSWSGAIGPGFVAASYGAAF